MYLKYLPWGLAYYFHYINIDKNSGIFLLLADISQRVHDYAISFFRTSKAKGVFNSLLDGINGLGPKRKEALLKKFITIDNIKNADINEIVSVGIPEDVARNIKKQLEEQKNEI